MTLDKWAKGWVSMAKLEALSAEQTIFAPPEAVKNRAALQDYNAAYTRSIRDNEAFWADAARELTWAKPWDKVSEFDGVNHRWFVGGETNITVNALERNLEAGRGDKTAYIWLGEDGSEQHLTYRELYGQVNRVANGLKSLGVQKGDRVVIYMPLTPQGVTAMLACARIGAVHSVVYAGFAAGALRTRIEDAGAKVVITGDVSYRRGKTTDLLGITRQAVKPLDFVEHVVVFSREAVSLGGLEVSWNTFQDQPNECPAEIVEAEHPLYILYTSGTTGKPKGVLHVHGGYMVGTYLQLRTFYDLNESDVFWNMSDIGWAVGHSYIAYAPLIGGLTTVFREGAPDTPQPGIAWEIVERYGVTAILTAPTVLRLWMRYGDEPLQGSRFVEAPRAGGCRGALKPRGVSLGTNQSDGRPRLCDGTTGGKLKRAHRRLAPTQYRRANPVSSGGPSWASKPRFYPRPASRNRRTSGDFWPLNAPSRTCSARFTAHRSGMSRRGPSFPVITSPATSRCVTTRAASACWAAPTMC